jgi:hypothetical protein
MIALETKGSSNYGICIVFVDEPNYVILICFDIIIEQNLVELFAIFDSTFFMHSPSLNFKLKFKYTTGNCKLRF